MDSRAQQGTISVHNNGVGADQKSGSGSNEDNTFDGLSIERSLRLGLVAGKTMGSGRIQWRPTAKNLDVARFDVENS